MIYCTSQVIKTVSGHSVYTYQDKILNKVGEHDHSHRAKEYTIWQKRDLNPSLVGFENRLAPSLSFPFFTVFPGSAFCLTAGHLSEYLGILYPAIPTHAGTPMLLNLAEPQSLPAPHLPRSDPPSASIPPSPLLI